MTKAREGLTELEGAILGVLRQTGGANAYVVRKQFLDSRSAEWSGSAGAVYPALQRLQAARLITARALNDGRGSRHYTLNAAGRREHDAWLCDVARIASPGIDPFRLRAGFWHELPTQSRKALYGSLEEELKKCRDELAQGLAALSAHDAIATRLHMALIDDRLEWLNSSGRN